MKFSDFHDGFIKVLSNYKDTYKDSSFALLLSGGLDSLALLFACVEIGLDVHCYTFTLDDRTSTDCSLSTKVCEYYSIPHTIVKVPTNREHLIDTMVTLARDYFCKTKTDFECCYPMIHLYEAIEEDIILSGHFSDDYFGLTKHFAVNYKKLEHGLDDYKKKVWAGYNTNQIDTRCLFDKHFNKKHLDPYNDDIIHKVFDGTTWDEINKPKIKMPIYASFKEQFDMFNFYHSDYQCGDSGIRETCADVLLNSKYNTKNFKSATGCYNEIIRSLQTNLHKRSLF